MIKNKALILFLVIFHVVFCSGAYDKGTAAGKGILEISITVNPFNLISYGQNYVVFSYGITSKTDLVGYYTRHINGTKSMYSGVFYQFLNIKYLDLGTACGIRYIFKDIAHYDLFFPQILYNFKLQKDYTIGGSIVKVNIIENNRDFIYKGFSLDLTFFTPITYIKKISSNITEAYFGFGIFKNSTATLAINQIYLHYSLDVKFDIKKIY